MVTQVAFDLASLLFLTKNLNIVSSLDRRTIAAMSTNRVLSVVTIRTSMCESLTTLAAHKKDASAGSRTMRGRKSKPRSGCFKRTVLLGVQIIYPVG